MSTRLSFQRTIHSHHIHQLAKVPGVVEVVHSEMIKMPLFKERRKHRLGLQQSGSPFMSIPTVRKVLETLFDVLEGNSDSINRLRHADKFASAAVFAFRVQSTSSGYQQREHFVYTAAKQCSSQRPIFSHSGGRRRLPLLHQVSPWRKVCIYMPIWVVPHNDWWIVMTRMKHPHF